MRYILSLTACFIFTFSFTKLNAQLNGCAVEITPSGEQTLCIGQILDLTAQGSFWNGQYSWVGQNNNTAKMSLSVQSDTFLVVQFSFPDSNCVAFDTVFVKSKGSRSVINALPNKDTIELGEILTMNVQNTPAQGTFSYEWTQDNTVMVGANSPNLESIVRTNAEKLVFKVKVTGQDGCVWEARREFVVVTPAIILPNAFTPGNGDNLNDKFELVAARGSIFVESLQIYNRWGTIVFEGSGTDASWDGTHNGQLQPTGTYYYYAKIRKGKELTLSVLNGELNLVR